MHFQNNFLHVYNKEKQTYEIVYHMKSQDWLWIN